MSMNARVTKLENMINAASINAKKKKAEEQ